MSLRYGVVFILFIFIILFLAYKNYEVWSQPKFALTPQNKMNKKLDDKMTGGSTPKSLKEPAPAPDSFRMIEEKNIFNPTRKEFSVLNVEQQQKLAVRPQIILYGVVITGDYQSASIANPGRPLHKGEREEMTVKLGDRIGDYQVKAILPDRIIVEAKGDAFDVLLYDPRTPKKRMGVKTEGRPAEITRTTPGSGPAKMVPPIPTGEIRPPSTPPVLPKPIEPTGERMAEPPVSPPVPTTPGDPGVGRGQRIIRPVPLPENEG